MINPAPAFQIYAKDMLASLADLSLEESGAYARALMWSWIHGPLPKNATQRGRILGASRGTQGARLWTEIRHLFSLRADGYVSPVLERERQKQRDYREKQAEKGRASAAARLNRGSTVVESGCLPVGSPVQPDTQPEPNSAFALSDLRSADRKDQDPRVDTRDSFPVTAVSRVPGPSRPGKTQDPKDQEPRADARKALRIRQAMAHSVFDEVEAGRLDALDAREELKTLNARVLGQGQYDATQITKDFESVEHTREARKRR